MSFLQHHGFFFISMFFGLLYKILHKMDILIVMRLSPATHAVSTSSPGCSPWHAWMETWPYSLAHVDWRNTSPSCVRLDGRTIAPCTTAGTTPHCMHRQALAAEMATPAAVMTLLECHTSSTRTGWTALSWRRSCTPLAFLDGIERRLLNSHEMHQVLQSVGIVRDVEARIVEIDLPVGQHHLEELDLERSFVVRERVVRSWKLGQKLVQMG
jgi:hypothetical protein